MYYTYMLRCMDRSIYTGITTDPVRRWKEHREGGLKAAKYTRSRRAAGMMVLWQSKSRSSAAKLEYFIKTLTKAQKEALAESGSLAVYADKLPAEEYLFMRSLPEAGE